MSTDSISVRGDDHKEWAEHGLKDFGHFSESVEYVNQSEYGDGQLEGEWWYADDWQPDYVNNGWGRGVVYHGTFGNYNSPGASSCTHATIYYNKEEYEAEVASWEAMPEYHEEDDEEDTEPKFYTVEVVEVRHFLCRYTIEAGSEEEAIDLAQKGETVDEDEIEDKGVADRSVQGTPELTT